jgi:uncharacterized HAD superfamily protein
VRLAIDIDSTLHPYWDQLAAVAKRRFGVDLSYDQQVVWEIERLRPEQLRACVEETHSAEQVLAAEPYPGAVEAIAGWHAAGHFIHITSHRAAHTHEHTERWLAAIGLRFDELYCSYDKVARCQELGIDVLIDDSPVNLLRAADAGITPATILHPWNRELCETEDVIFASDWTGLACRLREVLE